MFLSVLIMELCYTRINVEPNCTIWNIDTKRLQRLLQFRFILERVVSILLPTLKAHSSGQVEDTKPTQQCNSISLFWSGSFLQNLSWSSFPASKTSAHMCQSVSYLVNPNTQAKSKTSSQENILDVALLSKKIVFWLACLPNSWWHIGPYFNGLKRNWEEQNRSSFVGGALPLLLLYWRIN